MSKVLSVKMDDAVFETAERFVRKMHTNRNAYINRAVRFMNRVQERRILRERLRAESLAVRDENAAVLREFESIQDEGL